MARDRNIDESEVEDMNISSDGADDDTDDTDTDEGDGEDGEEEDDGSDLDGEEAGDEDDDDDGEEEEADDDLDPDAVGEIADEDDPEFVPKARFDEVNNRLKALEQKVGGGKPDEEEQQVPAFDLPGKLKERNEAMLEGDTDKATALDLEIEQHRANVATATVRAEMAATTQKRNIEKAIEHVQKKYPALNDKPGSNKQFDPEALADVIALRNGYISQGMSVASALQKAADRYFGKRGVAPAEEGKGGGKKKSAAELLRDKLRARQAKRAGQQPPSPTGKQGAANRTSQRVRDSQLTAEDLDDDTIARLERENPKLLKKLQGDLVE